jgi:hypothetical protein
MRHDEAPVGGTRGISIGRIEGGAGGQGADAQIGGRSMLSQSGTTVPLTQEQMQRASAVPVAMAAPSIAKAAADRMNPKRFMLQTQKLIELDLLIAKRQYVGSG